MTNRKKRMCSEDSCDLANVLFANSLGAVLLELCELSGAHIYYDNDLQVVATTDDNESVQIARDLYRLAKRIRVHEIKVERAANRAYRAKAKRKL